MLPGLAVNGGWLRLMGDAMVEQKERQTDTELAVSDEQAAYKERKQQARKPRRRERLAASRKRARAIARSQRRGAYGLHQKIATS